MNLNDVSNAVPIQSEREGPRSKVKITTLFNEGRGSLLGVSYLSSAGLGLQEFSRDADDHYSAILYLHFSKSDTRVPPTTELCLEKSLNLPDNVSTAVPVREDNIWKEERYNLFPSQMRTLSDTECFIENCCGLQCDFHRGARSNTTPE